MTKTQQILGLLASKGQVESHPDTGKTLAKIMVNDLFTLMGDEYDGKRLEEEKYHLKEVLSDLVYLKVHDHIQARHVKEILQAAWNTDPNIWDTGKYILDKKIFEEVSLDGIIDEVIAENNQAWEEYKSGKDKVIGRLIGSVMKKTNGKANPQEAKDLFESKKI